LSQKIVKTVRPDKKGRITLGKLLEGVSSVKVSVRDDGTITRMCGKKVFEVYAKNITATAYRIFWCYGPESGMITILAITSHS
jgi:hypothetical protein